MPARSVIELRDVDISKGADVVARRLTIDIVAGRVLALVSQRRQSTTAIADVLCGRTNGYTVEGDLVLEGRELISRVGAQDRTQAELFVIRVESAPDSRDSIRDHVRAALHAGRKDDVDHTVTALLERVGVPADSAQRRLSELSAAERLRIGFATAMARRPQVIVVDVPYVADATTLYATFSELLHRLSQQTPAAWVVTTDSLAVAADVADDVAVLLDGRIVEQGSVYDVCLRPAMPYTQDLLLVTPRPHRALPEYPAFVDLASHGGCPWVLNCRANLLPQCASTIPTLQLVGPGHEAACFLVVNRG